MRRATRLGALGALGLCLALLTACDTDSNGLQTLTVRIPDWDSSEVLGVRLWRLNEASRQFDPEVDFEFSDPFLSEGQEQVEYAVARVQGIGEVVEVTPLYRNPQNDDDVVLDLEVFPRPGRYRLTTFNVVGHSAFTTDTYVYER